jgi:hypothetical protein
VRIAERKRSGLKILIKRYSLSPVAAILVAATLSFAQFKSPDVKPRAHRPEPVRRTFFIPTPSAVQSTAVGAFQCLDNTLFPANFAGLFPDANASASCGTNPSESDTYTFKIAGTTIGQVALSGPAAITEVNSWAGSATAGSSSGTVNTSTGSQMQTNDVCVMSSEWYNGVTFSSITGGAGGTWTAVYTAFQNSSNQTYQGSYYHVVTSSDIGATFTVTWSGGAFAVPTITCYRGVNTSSPIDVSGSGSTGSSTTATAAGITTTHTGDAVIYVGGTGQASTLTVPSGFTQRWNTAWVNNTNEGTMGADLIGSYTSGTAESGTLGTSGNWTAVLFALAPSSSGSACTPTFTTTNGLPQLCPAGSRLEADAPATASGANVAISLAGHVP